MNRQSGGARFHGLGRRGKNPKMPVWPRRGDQHLKEGSGSVHHRSMAYNARYRVCDRDLWTDLMRRGVLGWFWKNLLHPTFVEQKWMENETEV